MEADDPLWHPLMEAGERRIRFTAEEISYNTIVSYLSRFIF